MPKKSHTDPVPPRAFTLDNCGLPFSRGTLYRWEGLGLFKLLRIGGRTLISAETVEDILNGKIKPPVNYGRLNAPKPRRQSKPASAQAAE